MTDDNTLIELLQCVLTHEADVRILGNVRAKDAARALKDAIELTAENKKLQKQVNELMDDVCDLTRIWGLEDLKWHAEKCEEGDLCSHQPFEISYCATREFYEKVKTALEEYSTNTPDKEYSTSGDNECICRGNWRKIVKETEPLIGKKFSRVREVYDEDGTPIKYYEGTYVLFGIVHGDDDYYYGMCEVGTGRTLLLSCVGSIEGHGYDLVAGS